jgi:hypothetical protein
MTLKRAAKRVPPFVVGVTGHRPNRVPEAQWARIKAQLADVMAGIEAEHPGRGCVLVSGLAEGADRLAAFVALGRGWRLHAILAFHRSRFEQDFPAPFALGEFRALLAAADRVTEPGRSWHRGRPAEDGYHAVGEAVLKSSDLLIAIWDGEGSRGKGGTIEVMESARDRGLPIVWVHATSPSPPQPLAPSLSMAKGARRGPRKHNQ